MAGATLGRGRGADQRDHPIREMGIGRPDFPAIELPAARNPLGLGAQRGQVAAGLRLTQADAKGQLAAGNAGEDFSPLLLGAAAQDERAGLPVANPMRANGSTHRQQFLQHHHAFEATALMPAIGFGPDHADPAARAEFAGEIPVKPHPGAGADRWCPVAPGLGQKGAQLGPQAGAAAGEAGQFKTHGVSLFTSAHAPIGCAQHLRGVSLWINSAWASLSVARRMCGC